MQPAVQTRSPWLALDDDAILCTFAFFSMHTMIKTARVCKRFRTLALAHPTLWWDASIDKKHPCRIARFLGVLKRGEGAPVRIDITDPRVLRRPADNVLKALNERAPRIVHLSLLLDPDDLATGMRIAKLIRSGAMCNLHTLVVNQFPTQAALLNVDGLSDTPANRAAPQLRRIAIPGLYLSLFPVLDSVEEANLFFPDVAAAALAEVFTLRVPHVRRLVFQAEQFHYGGFHPFMQRLCNLTELRIERIRVSSDWRHIDSQDIPNIIRSRIPSVSLHLAYPDFDRNGDIRAALQALPGPWKLTVRDRRPVLWNELDTTGLDVCLSSADGRHREWTLTSMAEALSSAFRPFLIDVRTTDLVLDGPLAWSLALRAADHDATMHVRVLHVVLPLVYAREKDGLRKQLCLHGLRDIIVESRAGDETCIPVAHVAGLFERLPPSPEGVYSLAVRNLRIDGYADFISSSGVRCQVMD